MKSMSRLGLALVALAALLTGVAHAGAFYTGLKVYVQQKNWEKAVSVGPQAIEGDADNPDAYNKFAIALAELDSLEHAGQMFQTGIDLAKKQNDAKLTSDIQTNQKHYYALRYNKAQVLLGDGNAVVDSLGARADTTKPDVKAALDQARDKFTRAATEFRQALYLMPQDAKAWTQIGIAYSYMGRLKEASDAYNKALAIEPGYLTAQNNLRTATIKAAEALKAEHKWDEAGALFDTLVAHGDTASLQDLGDIYYSKGKAASEADTATRMSAYRKAAYYYGEFAASHPDTMTTFNYAVTLLNARQYAMAEKVAKTLVAHNPLSSEYHSLLGDALTGDKTRSSAVTGERMATNALQQGKPVSPAALKPTATSDAAKVLSRVGRPDRAYAWTQSNVTISVWFYLTKGEDYAFVADKQVGKAAWLP